MIDTEIETKINSINVDEVVKALKKNKAKFLENFSSEDIFSILKILKEQIGL